MARIDDILLNGVAVSKMDLRRYLGSREIVTPADYGGVEGGIVDCAPAFAAAFATNKSVFVPPGVWRISAPIILNYGQSLFGVGDASVIQARETPWDGAALPSYPSEFNAIEIQDGYCAVRDLKTVGGSSGVKLFGVAGPCVRNLIENLTIWDARVGVTLDGDDNPDKPCYWNSFARILIARPSLHGVLLTVSTTGDTPNANKFNDVRVYSLSAPMTGCGFFLSTARYNNSFIDCEANVHSSAEACLRLGAMTSETRILNFYAECSGAVPGIRIDNGSTNTTIIGLFSATGGAPIWDTSSSRQYSAFDAGYPATALLKQTTITDLTVEGLSYATRFVEGQTQVTPDFSVAPMWLVSAYASAVQVVLPLPNTCPGRYGIIKKTDNTSRTVTITLPSGSGPDNNAVVLRAYGDFVSIISNGSSWFITSRHYNTPIGGWVNPGGSGFNRGDFNADDISNVGFAYDRNVVNDINYRLQSTRQVLRALILDLKTKGIISD
ncbi:Pectate_lyase_3 domain-containing protein [Azospirillaceae bacterium]